MPARGISYVGKDVYCHIYNRGVEKRNIFEDEQDYSVFLGFLSEYLTPPSPENCKKSFTVNGRQYSGIPHQPKNYFEKIELIAFSLSPNHFHLVIKQMENGAMEKFMRSLSTRYSIYFNRKTKRSGSLYEGPYKSTRIEDTSLLVLLTSFLHQEGTHSSFPEYCGTRSTDWIKSGSVLSNLGKNGNQYESFVKSYKFSKNEEDILKKLAIENTATEYTQQKEVPAENKEATADENEKIIITQNEVIKPQPGFLQIFSLSAGFIILFSLGLQNIKVTEAQNFQNQVAMSENSEVLSGSTEETLLPPVEPTNIPSNNTTSSTNKVSSPKEPNILEESPTPPPTTVSDDKIMGEIVIGDGKTTIPIYKFPSKDAEKIRPAKNGERFEIVSQNDLWVEIKIDNISNGYIETKYIVI